MAKKVTEKKISSTKKVATPKKAAVSLLKKTVKSTKSKDENKAAEKKATKTLVKKTVSISKEKKALAPKEAKTKNSVKQSMKSSLSNSPEKAKSIKVSAKIEPKSTKLTKNKIEAEKPKRKYVKKSDKENTTKIIIPNNKVEIKISSDKPQSVKSILISLPKPESGKSPYIDLANQFKIKLDWRPFTQVEGVKALDFRTQKIYLDQFQNVILTSKTSIEQYFRMLEDMRLKISPENKYFCLNEAIALYLQKYINYRKRKVFFGDGKLNKLIEVILKNKDKAGDTTYLIPSSETKDSLLTDTLRSNKIEYKEAILYKTVASDLSDLKNVKYDMLIFFNPSAIDSLYSNFSDFVQDKTRLAIFGNSTGETVMAHKLRIDVFAPTPENPSLVDAIKKYITIGNKK